MEDHGLLKLPGQFQLFDEHSFLGLMIRLRPVVIETNLTDGDDFGVGKELPQLRHAFIGAEGGLFRMVADSRPDVGVFFR